MGRILWVFESFGLTDTCNANLEFGLNPQNLSGFFCGSFQLLLFT